MAGRWSVYSTSIYTAQTFDTAEPADTPDKRLELSTLGVPACPSRGSGVGEDHPS
jgi:hypothetical protein